MIEILNKFFLRSKNLGNLNIGFQELRKKTEIELLFRAVESYSDESEIRYVGGCVRKILKNEKVNDIDLATNLNPEQIIQVCKKKNIKFYETGLEHGTITAIINDYKFEITSLRKDIKTDGRHADVIFTNDWKEDASRRDFSINSIYSDLEGNIFDPFNGKKDLEDGKISFIGDAEKRIREDYLRILRYIRFFLNYSKLDHNIDVTKTIKKNLEGVSKISSERLIDEFKKLFNSDGFLNLNDDEFSCEIISLIFPQFKNIHLIKNLNKYAKDNIKKIDFIFLISLMVVDGTDNADYFIYKFNISKKDQKRILFLNDYLKEKNNRNLNIKNLWKVLYFKGKESLLDLINFHIFRSKKVDKKLLNFIEFFKDKEVPILPLRAITLMTKYNIPEGEELGLKLKQIENKWVDNDFTISEKEVEKLING
ncbi:MAG: poly(A) polymerase [Pelagibacteraceae bacterium TMED268]|nr:MAG: poly(A) polymerase [Pelagibacteraceae bacterium TMED268]